MKLLLRRDQKSGLLGKVTFALTVRAELTDDEKTNIKKYKLGNGLLYEKKETPDPGPGWRGVATLLISRMTNLTITVNDLTDGKRIDCKDIVEMLAAEEQIKEAAQTFKNVLHAASTFGGEEALELT